MCMLVALLDVFFSLTAVQSWMNECAGKYSLAWDTAGMQFGDARRFIMDRAYEPFVVHLREFGINATRVVCIFESSAAQHVNRCTAVPYSVAATEMFQFLSNLCLWLCMCEPPPEWMNTIMQQWDRYLAFLEGLGCPLWPAVHYTLHHTADVYTNLHCAPFFFLEEAYEAAHNDKIFAKLTPHGRAPGDDAFNTWELVLHHNAIWASLTVNGTLAWCVHCHLHSFHCFTHYLTTTGCATDLP